MSSSIVSSAIQQKFLKLLQEINIFFAGERQLLDKDRSQLTLARTSAFELALETNSPHFDRFLTYLLGSTEINSDYPLQAVRMVCLTAKALQGEKVSAEQRQEVLTAALVADTGFRPAWLGHHGAHFEITAYQLKGLSLPWFTPGLERLIMNHHSQEEDPSPSRILSLIARYLGVVFGTGIEDIGQALVSPAKTMETLMAELHPEMSGLRLLLKAVSAFPLGSWVQMNSGQTGLVIGAGPRNPLRPKIGLYRDAAKNGTHWEEIDLEKKPTVHITGEFTPTAAQLSLLNFPEILVPGWLTSSEATDPPRQPPSAESVNASESSAPAASVLPATLKTTEDYRRFVIQKNRQSSPSGSMGPMDSEPHAGNLPAWKPDDLAGESFGSKHRLLKFYREELVKLRTTWEQQVRAAEQVSASLKSPLIESYRRENELMSTMIERLEAIGADVSGPAVPEPQETDALPSPEPEKAEAPAADATSVKLSENPPTAFKEIENTLDSFQKQVSKDQSTLRGLKEQFENTLRHLESREFQTLPSLIAFVRQWQEKLQPMQQQLEQSEQEAASLTADWNTLQAAAKALASGPRRELSSSWKEQIKPRMEKILSAASRALASHHRRLAVHQTMIERFCDEAHRLAV